jgi:uncharacterized surface protein with fasciclin (FAS1) repeats
MKMKKLKLHTKGLAFIKILVFSSAFLMILVQCEIQEDFEYEYGNPGGELNVSAWQFIQDTEIMSLMEEAVIAAGMQDYYSGSTEYTFILPRNSAFESFLSTNGYASISDIPVPILKNILLYQIIEGNILFSDPEFYLSNNPISYATENGQQIYLSRSSNYQGIINQGTNKSWTIITSNLEPTNGAIHVSSSVVYFSAVTGSTEVPAVTLESDTIFAIQDAYVRAGTNVDLNFGAADDLTLRVDVGSSNNDRKVFLMFDLSELTASGILREANLNLGVYYAAGKGTDINLQNVQDVTWSESSITWNTMPSPDIDVFSSIKSTPVAYLGFDLYTWDCTDYVSSKLASPGKVSIMMNAELGTNDGIMFVSKENLAYSYPAMLVAVYSAGNSTLTMGTNTGFTVANQGSVVLSNNNLQMEGALPVDIIYTLETAPASGWLVMGTQILTNGSKFSQLDIDVSNIVYVHSGASSANDSFSLSVKDRDGGNIDPFNVQVVVQ